MSYELTNFLINNPDEIYNLSPRKFEELVAFLFEKMGYQVTLTQQTRDNGVDIYALKKEEIGDILTIVDCKKFKPNRPVGIDIVRNMYGVLNIEKASHGVIATSSYFTSGAKDFQRTFQYQLSIKDHADIIYWMKKINLM